jgi:hypothetical protein
MDETHSSNASPEAGSPASNGQSRPASDVLAAFWTMADRVVTLASEDEPLRTALQAFAHAILNITDRETSGATTAPLERTEPRSDPAPVETPPPDEPFVVQAEEPSVPIAEALSELKLGQFRPTEEPAPLPNVARLPVTDGDLPLVERRCRLKADAARWAETRTRLLAEGAPYLTDIRPKDQDLIAQAHSLPDCFLWMCHHSAPSPSDPGQYEIVADCFYAAAESISVMRKILDEPELFGREFEQCLDLLAETQSALRVSIDALGGRPDHDQQQIYFWLKRITSESQVYIHRFMRLGDPADPLRRAELVTRAEALETQVDETLKRLKQRRKLLDKIRHKLSRICADSATAADHWPSVAAHIDELIAGGLKPSNAELRELLAPGIETLPAGLEFSANVNLVLREIDRYLANCPPAESPASVSYPEAVQKVAHLLKGRVMALIGGHRRPASQEALKSAFQLQELIWIETREHESVASFEPYIARPEVAVVLLAIRWSSHSHGEAQAFCDRNGKPLVRLPGGYNPNQVAAQILDQCSGRLGSA